MNSHCFPLILRWEIFNILSVSTILITCNTRRKVVMSRPVERAINFVIHCKENHWPISSWEIYLDLKTISTTTRRSQRVLFEKPEPGQEPAANSHNNIHNSSDRMGSYRLQRFLSVRVGDVRPKVWQQ